MLINKIEKKENGFSLIELLAVVGIGGALIAGALLLVNDVNSKKEIKQHSENISAIYANMTSLFSNESVSSASMANLITAGVFPSTLRLTSTEVYNSGNGEVAVAGFGDGFELTYNKIKAQSCVEVIRNQQRIGWDKFAVVAAASGATSADAQASGTEYSTTSVSNIAAACATASATNDWVSVAFSIE